MTIVLIGYMGSGKSFVGVALAKRLGYDFIDLDAYIETQEGQSISELFAARGEIYFRNQERYYLRQLMAQDTCRVLALGGGTPCYGDNLTLISEAGSTVSIYLKAGVSQLVERLFEERSKRPLIASITQREMLAEFIGKHLFERTPYYTQADIAIAVDGKKKTTIIHEIMTQINPT